MRIALFEPDIPQNTGTIIRTAACMGLSVDIIEPCGFVFSDRQFRRAGMDYLRHADVTRHLSWEDFLQSRDVLTSRLVLLSTHADMPYTSFNFESGDILILGRESAGVPDYVVDQSDARLCIPMADRTRSLNVAVAASMVLGEALRQVPLHAANLANGP